MSSRDITPALGKPGEPGKWRRAVEGAAVGLHKRGWGDGRWSYLYGRDTRYRSREEGDDDQVASAASRMRGGHDVPSEVQGPIMHAAVWTWEVPLYFWFGGMASGSSFVAVAAEIVGDDHVGRHGHERRPARDATEPEVERHLPRPDRGVHDRPLHLARHVLAAAHAPGGCLDPAVLVARRLVRPRPV